MMAEHTFLKHGLWNAQRYLLLVFFILLSACFPHNLLAHENNIVHSGLTNAAISLVDIPEVTARGFFDIHTDPECSFIDEGSVKEDLAVTSFESWDTDVWGINACGLLGLNWIEHAYNPITGDGWWDLGGIDALSYVVPIWEQVLWDYEYGEPDEFYFGLGRVCHLLEDMTAPAHVHGDVHAAGDDFEDWGVIHFDEYDFSIMGLMPYIPSGTVTLPDGNEVEGRSIEGFLHSLAHFTYEVSAFQGHLIDVEDPQPDSELARMFPSLHYYDGGILGDNYWEIDDIGGFEEWGSDEWWACVDDHSDYTDPYGVRHIEGNFYIENSAGDSGILTPTVFEKPGIYEANPNAKTLLQIYGDVLYVKAVSYCAGLMHLFFPVYFPDANLKAAVEDKLGVIDPTRADMLNLTYLHVYGKGIVDLAGLEYAANLTWLNLDNNQISDISAVSGLHNLMYLYLERNQITDISAVSGLTSLTIVLLYDNKIADISAVSGLTELFYLGLGKNQISDVSSLSGLINLERLYLFANQISDISAVSGLTNLNYLNLGSNLIGDISAVSGLTNLSTLHLWENQISDISPVAGLTNLTTLVLNWNQITDISPLSSLMSLTNLSLERNQITDISPLSSLMSLTYLRLEGNQITDISPLSSLMSLTSLNLKMNRISDISAVSGLTNLTRLFLYDNQVADISGLSGLGNLRFLYLHSNRLNTAAYCTYLPLIIANNPGLLYLRYDPNPNPLTDDCSTDLADLAVFVSWWLQINCNEVNNWCGGADLNRIDDVDLRDFAEFAKYWLAEL